MRLSSTFTAALGIGGGAGGDAASRRSAADASDSSRSSLSLTPGQGSTTAGPGHDLGGQPGSSSSLSASTGSLTAAAPAAAGPPGTPPRPINVGARGGNAGAASTELSSGGAPAGLDLSTYFGSSPAAAGPGGGGQGPGGGSWAAGSGRLPSGSRRATASQRLPGSPVLRGLVTRPELALCLLTEVWCGFTGQLLVAVPASAAACIGTRQ